MLNALLKEERAIVFEIAGTTRDIIEDEIVLGGIAFRFTDTAGIRETTDEIEAIKQELSWLENQTIPYLAIGNKADKAGVVEIREFETIPNAIAISAINDDDLIRLEDQILEKVNINTFTTGDTVVINIRHQQELINTKDDLNRVLHSIDVGITKISWLWTFVKPYIILERLLVKSRLMICLIIFIPSSACPMVRRVLGSRLVRNNYNTCEALLSTPKQYIAYELSTNSLGNCAPYCNKATS